MWDVLFGKDHRRRGFLSYAPGPIIKSVLLSKWDISYRLQCSYTHVGVYFETFEKCNVEKTKTLLCTSGENRLL